MTRRGDRPLQGGWYCPYCKDEETEAQKSHKPAESQHWTADPGLFHWEPCILPFLHVKCNHGLAASPSPGNLLKMHSQAHPGLLNQNLYFNEIHTWVKHTWVWEMGLCLAFKRLPDKHPFKCPTAWFCRWGTEGQRGLVSCPTVLTRCF